MITKWEDFPGVKKVYYGAGNGVGLIFEDDSFAVVVARIGYEDDAYPALANEESKDALIDAITAGASGAQELLDAAKAKFARGFEAAERRRLAYLLEKYGGEATSSL